jgi:hypothetical protein
MLFEFDFTVNVQLILIILLLLNIKQSEIVENPSQLHVLLVTLK